MDSLNPLTDLELRALVRDAIARARAAAPAASDPAPVHPASRLAPADHPAGAVSVHVHTSHASFSLGPGGDAEGHCIIEPSVRCTHCGFCQALGH